MSQSRLLGYQTLNPQYATKRPQMHDMDHILAHVQCSYYSPTHPFTGCCTCRHVFTSSMLLKLACLHSSASTAANNPLAWIGDAAMHLLVSEQLCARYPASPRGELARVRSFLISRQTFAEYSPTFGRDKAVNTELSGSRGLSCSKQKAATSCFDATGTLMLAGVLQSGIAQLSMSA